MMFECVLIYIRPIRIPKDPLYILCIVNLFLIMIMTINNTS